MTPSVYFGFMPVDIDATVIANRRLSADYNVLALAAPEIAAAARPGQFVMIKTSARLDSAPLLRRPFSIFEILRDAGRRVRRASRSSTSASAPGPRCCRASKPGARLPLLGPLGRPFEPVDPPAEAWMIAGGVGLAPFVTLAAALAARNTRTTLFYGARKADELYCVDLFEALGVTIVLATEDGSGGVRGRITVPLEAALQGRPLGNPVKLYVCGPTPMMRACAQLAGAHGRACDVSLEQVMGCGLGGCYSCVVLARGADGGAPHHTRRVSRARCSTRSASSGTPWQDTDGSLRQHRIADARESADRRERLLRLRRRVRRHRRSRVARRRRGQGAVPRRARRPSAAAHRRNAVGHAERDRPAGDRRAPLHRASGCRSCARAARSSSSTSAGPRSTSTSKWRGSSPTPRGSTRSS